MTRTRRRPGAGAACRRGLVTSTQHCATLSAPPAEPSGPAHRQPVSPGTDTSSAGRAGIGDATSHALGTPHGSAVWATKRGGRRSAVERERSVRRAASSMHALRVGGAKRVLPAAGRGAVSRGRAAQRSNREAGGAANGHGGVLEVSSKGAGRPAAGAPRVSLALARWGRIGRALVSQLVGKHVASSVGRRRDARGDAGHACSTRPAVYSGGVEVHAVCHAVLQQ